jgi:GTPase SAR1 family protein
MIVVEGPDGAGKTTLIEMLVQETNLRVSPRVVSKDAEAMVDLKLWVEQNVIQGFQDMIFDRHRLISEPIYGPILRDEFEDGFSNLIWFQKMLNSFYKCNPIIIYCLPPFDVVWKNVESDPDNKVVAKEDTLRAIWGAYFNKALTEYTLNRGTWIYDYSADDRGRKYIEQALVHTIKRRLKTGA